MHDHKLQADVERRGSSVALFGTADLPDGSLIRYEVWGGYLWGIVLGHRRRGEVRVERGQFAVTFDPAPWQGAVIDVVVGLRADRRQPKDTQVLLGSEGERLLFADVGGQGYSEHVQHFRKVIGAAT